MEQPCILIVDDHGGIRQLIVSTLTGRFHILHAGDGEEALRTARDVHPDLVILDLGLPRLSGVEVCRAIKTDPATRGTKVVAISGHHDKESLALEAGSDVFLGKPFKPSVLLAVIQTLLSLEDLQPGTDRRRSPLSAKSPANVPTMRRESA